jgi:phospholipid/cholesterol/gamma-HCH transport system substrate-binding protein
MATAQNRMRSLQLQVGGLILVAAGLLAGFVVVLGNFSFRGGYRVSVDFDYSGNLQSGAPVKISGMKVGKVEEVAFWGGRIDPAVNRRVQVRANIWVEDSAREAIRQNAEFFVNTAGVLGEQYLEVSPGDFNRPPLPAGSIVRGVDPPRTDLIVARLYEFLDGITAVLRDDKDAIRDVLKNGSSMVRTLDGILRDNREEIGRLVKNVDKLSVEASGLLASIHHGVGDSVVIERTLNNVEALSGSIRRDIDPLIAKTKKALDGVADVTGMIGPEEKRKLVGALDELVAVGNKVEGVTSDVQAIVKDVRKGKGTAGALLVEPQIYDDLKEMVRDLKRNPWKFFWKE